MREPLLRNDLPFGPDGFACHADPGMLHFYGPPCEQSRAWACYRAWSPSGSKGRPQPGMLPPQVLEVSGKARRKRPRSAICMASGARTWASSAGMAVGQAPAWGPA